MLLTCHSVCLSVYFIKSHHGSHCKSLNILGSCWAYNDTNFPKFLYSLEISNIITGNEYHQLFSLQGEAYFICFWDPSLNNHLLFQFILSNKSGVPRSGSFSSNSKNTQLLTLRTTIVLWDAEVLHCVFPISSHRMLKRHVLKPWDLVNLLLYQGYSFCLEFYLMLCI